ncbi:HNH endonuclease [Vibrio splendidus]|uniref:HNH nuclease domain-containing protein n=1 Tax=Vibrio splendidus 12E03 TaxID=1191305 RepID=A0A1E5FUK0_VIBSP|nr:HNH endonuclease [Vibrio splendidus]OEF93843.1 hypothetical protein A142_19385 [Vibrio splendidus 12E03]
MAIKRDDFLLSIWALRDDGTKVYPYKGQQGKMRGSFSVSPTGKSTDYDPYTEAELIAAIENGHFKERGTVRMLPLEFSSKDGRNGFSPVFFNGIKVKDFPIHSKEPTTKKMAEFEDERVLSSIRNRRGQKVFRDSLLAAFGCKCCISKSSVTAVLEAAHIIGHAEETNYSIYNGVLLRADIHTLFDLGLINIFPDGYVNISSQLKGTEYEKYQGVKILDSIPKELRENLERRLDEK